MLKRTRNQQQLAWALERERRALADLAKARAAVNKYGVVEMDEQRWLVLPCRQRLQAYVNRVSGAPCPR